MHDRGSRIRASDPAERAIPKLLGAHGGKILALGRSLCERSEDAEDLVQETFLRALKGWPRFEGRSAASAWLYTIAVRTCQRMRRRQEADRRRAEASAPLLGLTDRPPDSREARDEAPLEELIQEETRQAVQRAIARLPWHLRLPLVLKELAGFSLAEVAAVLDIRDATAKTRVHRARLLLRGTLQDRLAEPEVASVHAERRICMDLLEAKQEALDRGVPYPLPSDELCARCRSVFEALDLTHDICRRLADGPFPESLHETLLSQLAESSDPDRDPSP